MGKQTAHCKVGKQTEHTDFWKHRKKIKKVESFEKKVNFLKFQTIITRSKTHTAMYVLRFPKNRMKVESWKNKRVRWLFNQSEKITNTDSNWS
jgi:hypothetical protein